MEFINAHGVKYTPDKFLSYNDVVLLPQRSEFHSRNDPRIDLSTKLTSNINLNIPILSANMDTITEGDMVLAMGKQGAFGVLHRFYKSEEEFYHDVERIIKEFGCVAFSIGADAEHLATIERLVKTYDKAQLVACIDLAHGHLRKCSEQIIRIRKNYANRVQIIAGNVCTAQGVVDLVGAGANAVKIGIGGGSLCSTRLVTGHGMPMLTSIMQARQAINAMQSNAAIIADGGIKTSGDIIKALAAGADSVMIGGLLAATDEAPGGYYLPTGDGVYGNPLSEWVFWPKTEDVKGLYKKYRGQSSKDFMDSIEKTGVTPEGEHTYLPCKGPVGTILQNLIGGIRSGMTYSGVSNLHELSNRATFIEIGQHGYIEGTPHGV
jgi:IMP dehydrogenase